MPTSDVLQGVSNCYVFKSRLQEFAQKVGLPTPVYETTKEGPSHEPTFRSTVVVNDQRYDSLPGFFNRKAAEQSAAEVALMQLAQTTDMAGSISQPVHETGLCKNLLQEYAQKMNYAIPMYECRKDETPGRAVMFSCTVDIGGIKYIGAAARTKKEAEIKAARTALLAIQTSASGPNDNENTIYTVVPIKKKVTDTGINSQGTSAALKPKKSRFKKKSRKKKHTSDGNKFVQSQNTGNLEVHAIDHAGSVMDIGDFNGFETTHLGISPLEASMDHFGLDFFNENVETTTVIPCDDRDINLVTNSLNNEDVSSVG